MPYIEFSTTSNADSFISGFGFGAKTDECYYENNTKIQYTQVGDFNITNLILLTEETNITLGKWGMLHKDYLIKHKKVLFTTLLTQGKLYQHCAEVEKQAQQMFDTLVEQMKEREGVTEQQKEEDQLLWIQKVNNICNRAEEITINEINS